MDSFFRKLEPMISSRLYPGILPGNSMALALAYSSMKVKTGLCPQLSSSGHWDDVMMLDKP